MTIFLPNYFKNIFFFSSIIFFVFACKNENQNKIKVSVDRFDKKFQLSDSIELEELKQNYTYFFPPNYEIGNDDIIKKLFSENVGLVFQLLQEQLRQQPLINIYFPLSIIII